MLNGLRRKIIDTSYEKKLAHIGSNLSAVEIIDEIYSVKKPDEKFVLSSGHMNLALQVVLKERGLIEEISLETHPDISQKGIDCSTGSLGHGIGISTGFALANRGRKVYVLVSDGEMAEGSCWEILRLKSDLRIENLIIYVVCNGFSAYQEVNTDELEKRIHIFCPDVIICRTQIDNEILEKYPQLQGLGGHYAKIT